MSPELAEQLLALLAIIITAFFGWVSRSVVAKTKAGAFRDTFLGLNTIAEMVVRSVEQTLRPTLSDGKLTEAEQLQLKDAARQGMATALDTEGRKLGKEVIDHAIEAAVQKLHAEQHTEQPPA